MQVIWIYGRPGSGKTTLGRMLWEKMPTALWLDGDVLRKTINKGLGFTIEDRLEVTRRTINFILDSRIWNDTFIVTVVTPMLYSRLKSQCPTKTRG